ncbi:MAG: amidohydrolase family protein [Acidobacteriota bacterium]
MADSVVRAETTVVVARSTVAAVGPDTSFSLPEDVERIPCGGRYLLPGLADMHVHVGHRTELLSYLLAGVTTVVNLGGDHIDLFSGDRMSILSLRDAVESGDVVGPTVYSAGQALDGDPPTGPFQRALASVDEAVAAVDEQAAEGFDFIKVYDSLDEERHRAIVDRASTHGLAVFGHVPEAVGVDGTLASGQAVIAHAEELYPAIEGAVDQGAAIEALASNLRKAGVAIIPNGAFVQGLVRQLEDLEAELAHPEVAYLEPAVRVWWDRRYNYYVNRDDPSALLEQSRRRVAWIRDLVVALHGEGVPMLSGSDASIPVALPGLGLHRELGELTAAGLDPYEALRTATIDAGAFVAKHRPERGRFGEIEVGHRADLLVLDENPLDDLEALGGVVGVVVRGQWWPAEELRDLRGAASGDTKSSVQGSTAPGWDPVGRRPEAPTAGPLSEPKGR